jgi:hypothetical protein
VGAGVFAVVSNVVSIGPVWCVFAGPQESVEAAGQVIVDRRDYVRERLAIAVVDQPKTLMIVRSCTPSSRRSVAAV